MEQLLKQIGISTVSSLAVISLLFALFKRVFEKWIDRIFEKRTEATKQRSAMELAKFQAELEKFKESNKFLLQQRLQIHSEMVEMIYRLKNRISTKYSKQTDLSNLSTSVDEFRSDQEKFAELLYRSRFHMVKDLFDKLHKFKHLLEDFWTTLIVLRDAPEQATQCERRLLELTKKINNLGESCIKTLHGESQPQMPLQN